MSARPRPEIPLAVLGERARPVTLAAERALPVTSVLAPLLPDGGLPRGATVGVHGPGATALALALVAAASGAGSWTAVVGADDLGLVAAAEAGLALERTVVVADPPPAAWSTVVAALVESVEVVLVRASRRVAPGEQRRLRTHLRRRGGVLVRLPGPGIWPEDPDVRLRSVRASWEGAVATDRLDGAGRLRRRRLVVEAEGRGRAARPRRLELWLPGPDGAPAPLVTTPSTTVPSTTADLPNPTVTATTDGRGTRWAEVG
ncbi:MAG: hypothetical protein GXY13_09765 [Acidimicrobiales bacterium]|nr:hypothetical protein [Acidimicrobiales bacterium]